MFGIISTVGEYWWESGLTVSAGRWAELISPPYFQATIVNQEETSEAVYHSMKTDEAYSI